jgi:phage-related minor tail protein
LTLQHSRTFAAGWGEAFREYVDNATNAANIARDIFGSVTSAMESMLDNFVKTGKLNFKDFAKSIIQDILKIQLKASMLKIWEGLGGGGVGGFFRSLLGFADGGRPPLDQPSIVGERGPELFMPRTAGTVIPNHALGSLAPQPVVNNITHYHVNAVDAKSVAQLFMENRRTLLGVTEQARKELPIRQRF